MTGAGSNGVFRVTSFEEALKKRFSPKSIEGMTIPADGMNTDIHGSAEYRAHLVAVLARRALADGVAIALAAAYLRCRHHARRHARPCAGHSRLSGMHGSNDADGRDKPGHDGVSCSR